MRVSVLTIEGSQWLSDELDEDNVVEAKSQLSRVPEGNYPLAITINGNVHYFNRSLIIATALLND